MSEGDEPAFPSQNWRESQQGKWPPLPGRKYNGMTKREYYKAEAMKALIQAYPEESSEWIAGEASAQADAMLEERGGE